jgi:hypothetical protein
MKRLVLLAVLTSLPLGRSGAQNIDKAQLNSAGGVVVTDDITYQSFFPTATTVAGVRLHVYGASTAPYVTHNATNVNLWDAAPFNAAIEGSANPDAHHLAHAFTPYTIAFGEDRWIDVFFDALINVTPGHEYFFGFGGDVGFGGSTDQRPADALFISNGDAYPGSAYLGQENPNRVFGPASFDVAFIEYSTFATPEPSTLLLVSSGLLGLLTWRARARRFVS